MNKNKSYKIFISYSDEQYTITRKMILTTRPAIWEGTSQPIILPFSIYSAIYNGIEGHFKIGSFLDVIKANVRGKITVLMADTGHVNVLSLKYAGNVEKALNICHQEAQKLTKRFQNKLAGCEVVYAQDFVRNDHDYPEFKNNIINYYKNDTVAQIIMKEDINKSYTKNIAHEYPNKASYDEKAELDFLEMAIDVKVMEKKGYQFFFYPGPMPNIIKYLSTYFFAQINYINVGIRGSSDIHQLVQPASI